MELFIKLMYRPWQYIYFSIVPSDLTNKSCIWRHPISVPITAVLSLIAVNLKMPVTLKHKGDKPHLPEVLPQPLPFAIESQ